MWQGMPPSTTPTMVAVLTPAVAEHQRWAGLAGVAEWMHLSCTSVLQQNIKGSILITKYVSLRLPPSFSKRDVFYIVWKCPWNCAVWLLFLGEDLEKKHLKVLVVTVEAVENNWGVEDTVQSAWSSLWLLEKPSFFALNSGSYCVSTEP